MTDNPIRKRKEPAKDKVERQDADQIHTNRQPLLPCEVTIQRGNPWLTQSTFDLYAFDDDVLSR